jgi:photosystem II stability/assembly factor-like uncharacterized protein
VKKFLILILAVPFIAASCDAGGLFDFGGGGTRGIFKSEDNGVTFNASSNLEKKGDISNLAINTLAQDQTNPDILYAGSSSGIHKTENGAKTWRYMLSGITVSSIAIDQFTPSTVYASGIVGQNGKIIKSVDSGTSWVDIYTEPSKSNTVLSIAVSSVSSSTILAGLNNGELIRSTDSGATWQATKDFADRVIDIKFGSSATAYALTSKSGLYKSTDLGVTWTHLTSSLTQDTINSVNKNATSITAFFELALDPKQNGVLYLGAEQGLFRSVNDGKDWNFISLPVKNSALRVSAVSVNPQNSNNLFVSIASTLYKSLNGGLTWETRTLPTSTTIHTIVINPQSTNIIYLGLRTQ